MTKLEISMIIGMITAVLFAGVASFAQSYSNITNNVFRLHILANSDEGYDQEVKLLVRDEILRQTSYIFEDNLSAQEAAEIAARNIPKFEQIAKETLTQNGYDYDVNCEVKEVYFPARVYGDITLPAGTYTSLQVNIGESNGANWWCVMFPPLCIPAVSKEDDIMIADEDILCGVFNDGEVDIMLHPEKYEVKFYFVDLYHKLSNKA